MEKNDFYKILCSSTPEELNEFISSRGKTKAVNAITFITDEEILESEKEFINNKLNFLIKENLN